jgi:putative aldouronate transport system permease protein
MKDGKKAAGPEKTAQSSRIQSWGENIFLVFNRGFLLFLMFICVLPFWYVICLSLSSNGAVIAGRVGLWPVEFTLEPYQYVLERLPFWRSFMITIERVALVLPLSLALIILSAYPLSKISSKFHFRSAYVWYFFFTMLFNGGMITSYLLIRTLGMLDTIWALVLPGCLNVFNMLLVLSFFRQVPVELEEAAFIDGASHWRILWQVYVPVSVPVIATVTLFIMVQHWNSWFDGMIYMRNINNAPLQTYLRSIIMNFSFANMTVEEHMRLARMNIRSVKAAQMVIGAIPILAVYPFLQKYFIKGITLGSVKG